MKAFLALLPLACVALAGGTTVWSQAIMMALVGAVLLVAPPRFSLGWRVNAALLALVALALTAFLPARWFAVPVWRAVLAGDLQTPLPDTLSVQPWLSADALAVFLLGLCWLYLVAAAAWTTEERLRAGRVLAGGVAVLSVTFVAVSKLGINVPIWHSVRGFGPFPNRNQTADFLAVGALPALALARVAWRARRFPAMGGWLLAWMAVAAGVFNDYSRAGVGILFAGSTAYLGYETLRRGSGGGGEEPSRRHRRLAVAVSLVLLLASGFAILGGETLQRVRSEVGEASAGTVSGEFRLLIQRDALDLVAASPWCGVGLGNFGGVFAEYRTRSAVPARAIHPESDWLWTAGELGWVSLVPLLAGLGLFARRMWPPRRGEDRPLRAAAAIAVGLFAAHALADVPAHRLGTAMSAALLAGLALPGRGGPLVSGRWPGIVFRALGLGFVALGVCWWQAASAGWDVPGQARAEVLSSLAWTEVRAGDYPGGEQAASRALRLAPLDWKLYYLRGTARVCRHQDAAALADFRRARYLEPFFGSLPEAEAQIWAVYGQADLAASALLEACRREPGNLPGYVNSVLGAAARRPAVRRRITELAASNPTVQVETLSSHDPQESAALIADIARTNPGLSGYSEAVRKRFLAVWAQHGDAQALIDEMTARPDWQASGWREWAEAERRLDHFQAACGILAAHVPPPALPPAGPGDGARSRAELEQASTANAGNPLFALRLYRARRTDGDAPGALAALQAETSRADCPGYFHYLEATATGEAGRWPEAWEAWVRYLDAASR